MFEHNEMVSILASRHFSTLTRLEASESRVPVSLFRADIPKFVSPANQLCAIRALRADHAQHFAQISVAKILSAISACNRTCSRDADARSSRQQTPRLAQRETQS